jgi:hypothetical protein
VQLIRFKSLSVSGEEAPDELDSLFQIAQVESQGFETWVGISEPLQWDMLVGKGAIHLFQLRVDVHHTVQCFQGVLQSDINDLHQSVVSLDLFLNQNVKAMLIRDGVHGRASLVIKEVRKLSHYSSYPTLERGSLIFTLGVSFIGLLIRVLANCSIVRLQDGRSLHDFLAGKFKLEDPLQQALALIRHPLYNSVLMQPEYLCAVLYRELHNELLVVAYVPLARDVVYALLIARV